MEGGFSKVDELIGAPNVIINMDWTDTGYGASPSSNTQAAYDANTMMPQHTMNAAFADMDGSGTVDVVLVCNGGLKQVWTNDGRGNFALKSNAINNNGNAGHTCHNPASCNIGTLGGGTTFYLNNVEVGDLDGTHRGGTRSSPRKRADGPSHRILLLCRRDAQ